MEMVLTPSQSIAIACHGHAMSNGQNFKIELLNALNNQVESKDCKEKDLRNKHVTGKRTYLKTSKGC